MSDLAKPINATENQKATTGLKSILPDNAFNIVNDILSQSTQFQSGFGVDDGTVLLQPVNRSRNDDQEQKHDDNQSESDEIQLDEGDLDSDDSASGEPPNDDPLTVNDETSFKLPAHTDDDSLGQPAHNKNGLSYKQQNNNNNNNVFNNKVDSDDEKGNNLNNNTNMKSKTRSDSNIVNLSIDNPESPAINNSNFNNNNNTNNNMCDPDNDDIILEDDTKQTANGTGTKNKKSKADFGSRTMEQWLNRDNLIVHPVWIGNLPRNTTVNQLRHFVESQVGRVLVSIHISVKEQINKRTYAFLNLPTAEKQLLAVTLLDGSIFTQEKLIVRPKRPSKFPQSYFGSSPISEHFKHFRDCVVPAILANPQINLNVTSVRKILDQNRINIDHLPNRVWCVQCTLVPQCHRTYCSFYHCHQEKELGRIISILAAQICGGDQNGNATNANGTANGIGKTGDEAADSYALEHERILVAAKNPNTQRSRHTLLIQGLPRSITAKKMEEIFEVFGEIDNGNVIVNPDHTCYVRMKRSQDARKIVHLFKYNHAGVVVDFAPYGANKMADRVANAMLTANGPQSENAKEPVKKARLPFVNSQSVTTDTRYNRPNRLGLKNSQSVTMKPLPVVNPSYQQQRPYNPNMNKQMTSKPQQQSARSQLRFERRHTEPIATNYQRPTPQNTTPQAAWMHAQQNGYNTNNISYSPHPQQPPQYAQYYQQPHTHAYTTATGYTSDQLKQYQMRQYQMMYQNHHMYPTHATAQAPQPHVMSQPQQPAMSQPMVGNQQFYYPYQHQQVASAQPQIQNMPQNTRALSAQQHLSNRNSAFSPTSAILADSIPTPRMMPPQPLPQPPVQVERQPPVQQIMRRGLVKPSLANAASAPDPYYHTRLQRQAIPQASATYPDYYTAYAPAPDGDMDYINVQKQTSEKHRDWLKQPSPHMGNTSHIHQFVPYTGQTTNKIVVESGGHVGNNNNAKSSLAPPQLHYGIDNDPLSPTTVLQHQAIKANEKKN